jgi:hypothetical protein
MSADPCLWVLSKRPGPAVACCVWLDPVSLLTSFYNCQLRQFTHTHTLTHTHTQTAGNTPQSALTAYMQQHHCQQQQHQQQQQQWDDVAWPDATPSRASKHLSLSPISTNLDQRQPWQFQQDAHQLQQSPPQPAPLQQPSHKCPHPWTCSPTFNPTPSPTACTPTVASRPAGGPACVCVCVHAREHERVLACKCKQRHRPVHRAG